jgi:leader peptidase (prepilin peptidase)/N-methyltransferase
VPAYLYFAAIGVSLTVIDLQVRRLPNAIVLTSYPVVVALLAASATVEGNWRAFGRALLGGAVLFAFFFALAYFYPAGMGLGDVKLAGIVGGVLAYLSWSALVIGAFAGFLIGAVAGLTLMAIKRAGRKTEIPFGPSMIAGALVAIFAAQLITQPLWDTLVGV